MFCEHQPTWIGDIAVVACSDCQRIDWFSGDGPLDPSEGMAALFGNYDLIGPVEALAAPAPRVLAYSAPNARKRTNLKAFPKRVWLKSGPHLWLSHDGQVLLLAPTTPLAFENLTRGA